MNTPRWPLYQGKARDLQVNYPRTTWTTFLQVSGRGSECYVVVIYSQSTQGCSTGTEDSQTNSIKPTASSFDLVYALGFSEEIYESSQSCTSQRGWKLHKNPAQRGIPKPLDHCRDKVLSLAQDPCKALSDSWGLISSCTKRTRGTTELITCWLMSSIYMSHHRPPQLIVPRLTMFQSISGLPHGNLQQAKAISIKLYYLVWTPECELKMG